MHLDQDGGVANGSPLGRRGVIAIAVAGVASTLAGAGAAKQKRRDKKKDTGKRRGKRQKQRASGSGRDIVRVARKYKGARYEWGGASPKGFDCSGFTWYVYQKATGMDISRGVEEQWKRGKSVGKNDWKPGDIVFFKNTFERGLSHNGIYIGGDEFIHAENERTGVVISSMSSDYYSSHYAGARRLV